MRPETASLGFETCSVQRVWKKSSVWADEYRHNHREPLPDLVAPPPWHGPPSMVGLQVLSLPPHGRLNARPAARVIEENELLDGARIEFAIIAQFQID